MNNKFIIVATICFLLISFIFLSFVEQKKQDPNSHEWWAIYFENPKNSALSFVIENHLNDSEFSWEIYSDKNKTTDGKISLKKGEQKTIPITLDNTENKKMTIIVADKNNNKKEIYKILP